MLLDSVFFLLLLGFIVGCGMDGLIVGDIIDVCVCIVSIYIEGHGTVGYQIEAHTHTT